MFVLFLSRITETTSVDVSCHRTTHGDCWDKCLDPPFFNLSPFSLYFSVPIAGLFQDPNP